MSLTSLEMFCKASVVETMFKLTLPATHIVRHFGKKERIVTISRSMGTRGSYGFIRLSEAVVDIIDNFVWLIISTDLGKGGQSPLKTIGDRTYLLI